MEKKRNQAQGEQKVLEGGGWFAVLKWVPQENLTEHVTFERPERSNKTLEKYLVIFQRS